MFRRWSWGTHYGNTVSHSKEVQAAWEKLTAEEWRGWQDLACFTFHCGFTNVICAGHE
jgi:hypothetical protein